jgi:hypothetical protein
MMTYVLLVDDKVAATFRAKDLKAAAKLASKKRGTLAWLIWRRGGKTAGVREADMHEHAAWRANQAADQVLAEDNWRSLEQMAEEHDLTERQVVAALSNCRVSEVPKERWEHDPDESVLVNWDFMEPTSGGPDE